MSAWAIRLQGAARYWGWLLLLALAPFFIFIYPVTAPILLVVPVLLAMMWVPLASATGSARPARSTPLDWALLLLALMVLVSLWATFSIAYSLPKIAGIVFGLGLFYSAVARGQASSGGWIAMAGVYLTLGAGVAGIGLLGTRWSAKIPVLGSVATRLPGSLIILAGVENGLQPNEVAGVLLWVAPVAAALAVALWLHFDTLAKAHGRATILAVAAAITLVAVGVGAVLALTQSRSALFALALAVLVMLLLAGHRARRSVWAMLGVGALVGVALFGRQLQALYDYAGSGPVTSPEPGLLFASLDQRVEIWSRAIDGIEDFPFTGMGLNTFRKLVFVLYPLSLEGPEVDLGHAHNIWLQVSLDLGLPGLVAYLAIWFSALAMLA